MLRKTNLVDGETYHVFNRGAHKSRIFTSEEDYKRFSLLLHLCNESDSLDMRQMLSKYKGRSFVDIFLEEKPDKSLVSIFAYCLMPNHFHLVLRQKSENGISKFLKRVGTAYSMYFNTKYEHSGVVFQGRFKSIHINSESYFRYIFAYVHLNPIELVEAGWKEKGIRDIENIRQYVNDYNFSSFSDYVGRNRPENNILSLSETPEFLKTQNDLEELLLSVTKDGPLEENVDNIATSQ